MSETKNTQGEIEAEPKASEPKLRRLVDRLSTDSRRIGEAATRWVTVGGEIAREEATALRASRAIDRSLQALGQAVADRYPDEAAAEIFSAEPRIREALGRAWAEQRRYDEARRRSADARDRLNAS